MHSESFGGVVVAGQQHEVCAVANMCQVCEIFSDQLLLSLSKKQLSYDEIEAGMAMRT